MKFALISDIHGNLQALEALLADIKHKGIKEIICLGDTIAIGPHSEACMTMLIDTQVTMVLGNHETYYLEGAENFEEVGPSERLHQKWVSKHLNQDIRKYLMKQPYKISKTVNNQTFAFLHYARKAGQFVYSRLPRTVEVLDELFSEITEDVIIYGHEHDLIHEQTEGQSIYICVGSSGCTKQKETHYSVLDISDHHYDLKKVMVNYDRDGFIDNISNMVYPDKKFIAKAFFGLDII